MSVTGRVDASEVCGWWGSWKLVIGGFGVLEVRDSLVSCLKSYVVVKLVNLRSVTSRVCASEVCDFWPGCLRGLWMVGLMSWK